MGLLISAVDIESTGLLEPDHRIVEVNVSIWRDGAKLKNYTSLVDPQRSIDPAAMEVHKITPDRLVGAPLWEAVGPIVHKMISVSEMVVWHNGDEFDGPFLHKEFIRIGLPAITKPTCDTMKLGRWAHHSGKSPSLEELCFACGVPYDPALAHAAEYDVDRMMDCFYRAQSWGYYQVPALAA